MSNQEPTRSGATDVEVAVVGGGPVVGLLKEALLLARAGVDTALVEKAVDVETDLRASTFHPPTLDLLDDIGLGQALVAQGLISPQWQVRLHPEGHRAVFDLGVIANRHLLGIRSGSIMRAVEIIAASARGRCAPSRARQSCSIPKSSRWNWKRSE